MKILIASASDLGASHNPRGMAVSRAIEITERLSARSAEPTTVTFAAPVSETRRHPYIGTVPCVYTDLGSVREADEKTHEIVIFVGYFSGLMDSIFHRVSSNPDRTWVTIDANGGMVHKGDVRRVGMT